jgi:hypothetical protein
MSETRHAFITPGISQDAFLEMAAKRTSDDPDLVYYLHAHKHFPLDVMQCNQRCQIVQSGKATFVTHSDDANPQAPRVS